MLVEWIKNEDLKNLYSNDYLNNVELEKEKEWWIESADDISKNKHFLSKNEVLQ